MSKPSAGARRTINRRWRRKPPEAETEWPGRTAAAAAGVIHQSADHNIKKATNGRVQVQGRTHVM